MEAEIVRYQFDSVEVQPAVFSVLRDGRSLSLEPKAVRTLLYLIEHRDRAVSKDDLIAAIWEGAAVTDNALTRIVAQLRRELGDDARQSRYIQTLPTLGYRFIADLKVVSSPAPASPRPRRMVFGSAAALLAAVFAGSMWLLMGRSAVAPSLELQPVQLTTSPNVDIGGSFSPDGKSFAYSSNRKGWFEIYVRPVSSGGVGTQITSDGKQNVEPAWSPDGKWIAYRSVAQRGIWLVPASGGAPRRLTAFGSAPAWAPDGSRIAFRSLEPYSLAWFDFPGIGESTVWTVAADGSQLRRITVAGNPRGQHTSPSWSPDGKRVAFSTHGGQPSLWTVDASSGELKSVPVEGNGILVAPVFAPNGKDLYCTGASNSGSFAIYRLPLSGGKPVELYATRNDVPKGVAASPDGRRLLYTRVSNISQLWITGARSEPAKPIYEDAVIRAKLPSFSPDGKRLAYMVRPAGGTENVWMMNADGSGAVPVTDEPGIHGGPGWSADGTAILYSATDGKRYQLRRIDPAVRTPHVVWESTQRVGMPHVTADEREMIFIRPSPVNVWKLVLQGGAPKQLTFDREGASFPSPSWDGQWIAYELNRGESVQIAVMDRNGGHRETLTDDTALNWSNSWASDNRRIAYASYSNGVWNLYSIDRVTRERKQLTRYTAYGAFVRNPAWRPGTEEVVYEYSQVKGNVYLMNLR